MELMKRGLSVFSPVYCLDWIFNFLIFNNLNLGQIYQSVSQISDRYGSHIDDYWCGNLSKNGFLGENVLVMCERGL